MLCSMLSTWHCFRFSIQSVSKMRTTDYNLEMSHECAELDCNELLSARVTKQKPAIKKLKPYDHRRSMLRVLAAEQKHALASGSSRPDADSAALELPPEEQRCIRSDSHLERLSESRSGVPGVCNAFSWHRGDSRLLQGFDSKTVLSISLWLFVFLKVLCKHLQLMHFRTDHDMSISFREETCCRRQTRNLKKSIRSTMAVSQDATRSRINCFHHLCHTNIPTTANTYKIEVPGRICCQDRYSP